MKKVICLISFLIGICVMNLSAASASGWMSQPIERKNNLKNNFLEKQRKVELVDTYSFMSNDNSNTSGQLRGGGIGEIEPPASVGDGLFILVFVGIMYATFCIQKQKR